VTAEDPVELMVGFLNEIVTWCDSDDLVPTRLDIRHVDDRELQATLFGESFDPARHTVERQVKAVTYHRASLEQNPHDWSARVYVDL